MKTFLKKKVINIARKSLLKIKNPLRNILGIEDLRAEIEKANSILKFVSLDQEKLGASREYKNYFQFVEALRPMDILGQKYVRIGRDYDGGYVMLDNFEHIGIDAAYSLGINDDVSWDLDIANKGIKVFMYDHTINSLPDKHKNFQFTKLGVAGDDIGKDIKSFSSLIKTNGHEGCRNLILKMDIEGYEWDLISKTPEKILSQFSQITLELHDLDPRKKDEEIQAMVSVLEKLNNTHQVVHVHGNVFGTINWICGYSAPASLEVTYIRKSDYDGKFIENARGFPTKIDQSCSRFISDVELNGYGG